MKKLLALLMALCLVFCLVACSSSDSSDSSDTESESASDTDTEATEEAEEDEESEDAESSSSGGEYTGESFTILMASDGAENLDQNAPMVYFRDHMSELSDGAVTVQVSWGGTEYDNSGIWEALSSNLLNMDIALMTKHNADAPLMNWGFMPYSSNAQESIDQTNYMLYENETTSQIIADYLASFNMTLLGNSCDGAPSFVTTFDWDTLDDLVSKSAAFGTMNTAKYAAIGLNCVAVPSNDCYDNLDRGIIDGCSIALASAMSSSLYEVAPYDTVDGQYTSAVLMLVNTDFYNDLSEEAQALIQQCVDDTVAFSAEHVTESTMESAEEWEEETGNAVKFLSEEDGRALWAQTLAATAENAKANSEGSAYEDDMKTLLEEWIAYQEDYHGFDVDFEW